MFKKLLSMVLCAVMVLGMGTTAFAVESKNTMPVQIIGQYDGLLRDVIGVNEAQTRGLINVRINSYATYDKNNGIQVKVKLYTPDLFANPKFTSMAGTVDVLINNRTTSTAFSAFEDNSKTIETDVDTGVTASSGTKGTVSVAGVATATNAIAGGGAFAISYPVTIP